MDKWVPILFAHFTVAKQSHNTYCKRSSPFCHPADHPNLLQIEDWWFGQVQQVKVSQMFIELWWFSKSGIETDQLLM